MFAGKPQVRCSGFRIFSTGFRALIGFVHRLYCFSVSSKVFIGLLGF